MCWTHGFDLLGKLLAIGIVIGVIVGVHGSEPGDIGLPVLVGIILAAIAWWFLLRPLSSWLYARVKLGAVLSPGEAWRASMLFSPVLNLMKWHPLVEVLSLPESDRVQAINQEADKLAAYYKARADELRRVPFAARMLRAFLWLLVVGSIIGCIADALPFSWLSSLQARLFGGYSCQLFSALVVIIPIGCGIAFIEKRYGVRSPDIEAP